ncbi:MAG: hypothetical protein D6677_11720, partial [Calditrichaeota bacterium]
PDKEESYNRLGSFKIGKRIKRHITKAICHLGNVLYLYFLTLNKISSKLKVYSFKIPNYA